MREILNKHKMSKIQDGSMCFGQFKVTVNEDSMLCHRPRKKEKILGDPTAMFDKHNQDDSLLRDVEVEEISCTPMKPNQPDIRAFISNIKKNISKDKEITETDYHEELPRTSSQIQEGSVVRDEVIYSDEEVIHSDEETEDGIVDTQKDLISGPIRKRMKRMREDVSKIFLFLEEADTRTFQRLEKEIAAGDP